MAASRSHSATCLTRSPKAIVGRKRCCGPRDDLESTLGMFIAAKEEQQLPAPSKAQAVEEMVPLSALGMAKTTLYDAMRAQGVRRAELARQLCWHLPQVNRV